MARRKISIFESFLSGGNVGSSFLSSAKDTLNASTRNRSLDACADRYLNVARRLRRRSSLVRGIPLSSTGENVPDPGELGNSIALTLPSSDRGSMVELARPAQADATRGIPDVVGVEPHGQSVRHLLADVPDVIEST